MRLKICWVGKTKEAAIQNLTTEYLTRIGRYLPTEAHELRTEAALLELMEKERTRPTVVLLDVGGQQLSSPQLAEFLEQHQNRGTQSLLFAVGPTDGFSAQAMSKAAFTLSLGKMTLAHELARVVLLEQIYRAFTIMKGHPYHLEH